MNAISSYQRNPPMRSQRPHATCARAGAASKCISKTENFAISKETKITRSIKESSVQKGRQASCNRIPLPGFGNPCCESANVEAKISRKSNGARPSISQRNGCKTRVKETRGISPSSPDATRASRSPAGGQCSTELPTMRHMEVSVRSTWRRRVCILSAALSGNSVKPTGRTQNTFFCLESRKITLPIPSKYNSGN